MTSPISMPSPAREEDEAYSLVLELTTMIRQRVGLIEPLAAQIAQMIVDEWRSRRGGERVYIPMRAVDRQARDAAIRAEFDGSARSRADVCRKWGISKSTFYNIVGRGKPSGRAPKPG